MVVVVCSFQIKDKVANISCYFGMSETSQNETSLVVSTTVSVLYISIVYCLVYMNTTELVNVADFLSMKELTVDNLLDLTRQKWFRTVAHKLRAKFSQ